MTKEQLDTHVFDFDGTITEVPPSYEGQYLGLLIDECIVAPPADLFILLQSAARITIDILRYDSRNSRLQELVGNKLEEFLNGLYKAAYVSTGTVFKPDAYDSLKRLNSRNCVIITNTDTDLVRAKIDDFLGPNKIIVVGNTKKFLVDDTWDKVPETLTMEGLSRPVRLRRRQYYEKLKELSPVVSVTGDIGELDLVLPSQLGIFTALVVTAYTRHWEKNYFGKRPNSFVAHSLNDAVDKVLSLERK